MIRKIKRVAVLGSGVMGSGIACHLANAGMEVLMLDIVPKDDKNRNAIAQTALKNAIKSKPAPLFKKEYASRITVGNFDDDLQKITNCDWIIEVIIENPTIKQSLYEKVEKYRTPGTLISTNTSGIPINLLAQGRSEDFKKCFLGTHFFNPPRYLPLLEIIPSEFTSKEVVDFFMEFGDKYFGKQGVICKDTPGFIANRIGLFSMAVLMELTEEFDYPIEAVDVLTGSVIGRPNTGTFRLMDLVGIDVADKVLKGLISNLKDDEYLQKWENKEYPAYLKFLLDNKFLGNKTRVGFYKKTKEKDAKGKSIILALDLKELEYKEKKKIRFDLVKDNKKIDSLKNKMLNVFNGDKEENKFLKKYFLSLFSYVSNRIPEISDNIFSIDDAMKAGYAWEAGPFEYWDMIGMEKGVELAEAAGFSIADWVKDMVKSGRTSFYQDKNNKKYYFDKNDKNYVPIPGLDEFVILDLYKEKPVFKNSEAAILDIGDGVLNVEFRSKSNVIGEGTGLAVQKAIQLAEEEGWKGIVIGNDSKNFTVGANLMMIAMLAFQKDYKKLDEITNDFQQVNMQMRYSKVPIVTATQGYVFGGGVEIAMHTDSVMAAAESYIGLVEVGVGLLPGGGGTKEFAVRLSEGLYEGDVVVPKLIQMFKTIATAQVATSADEAFDLNYLKKDRDFRVMNTKRVISEAKNRVLQLSQNYVVPDRKRVKALGRGGLATLYAAINEFKLGKFITEHEAKIANKIAYIMCGGDLTGEQVVSEQYLLDLEREGFLSLLGDQKTLERIQYMLENNKPLRN